MGSNSSMEMLDDPLRLLSVRKNGDMAGWRSRAVSKEPWTYEWLKDFDKQTVFWDIGACIGSYSLMAAARGATVYAFEPFPVNYNELQENIRLNRLTNKILAAPIAAGSDYYFADLHVHEDARGIAGYGLASTETTFEDEAVYHTYMQPLGDLSETVFTPPTHVKMDVEGGEYKALLGMQRYFNEKRIESLIVEIVDDYTEGQINTLMSRFGYMGKTVEQNRTTENVRTIIYERD